MNPVDNSQFTEDQRTEAFRQESMAQLMKQTKALESIRAILLTAAIASVIIGVMVLFFLSSIAHL